MEFRDQVKAAADIVQVVNEFVPLRKAGPNSYKGLCPFHSEKTPSFHVNPKLQIYKCFGCGAGGDAFKFVMEMQNLTFFEALRFLAERYGIPVPKRSTFSDEDTKRRASLYEMNEFAARTFRSNLASPAGAEARAYLERRGVSPELAAEFGLGLSGSDLARKLQREGFTADQLAESGLARRRDDGSLYDYFRNRLMFPIHAETGKAIGFGARAMAAGDEPKYLNSPETPIYKKQATLYNLHRAKDAIRKSGRSVLVEGYMDVIGVYGGGVQEVVASCGTALTNLQVRSLHRQADRIVVNFDPDTAGVNAAERSIQMLLDESMMVRVLELEEDLDPDEYVKKHGGDVYRQKLDQAPGYFYWLADRARARFDMRTGEGKVAAFKFLNPSLERITDRIERATMASDVASYLGIDPAMVLEQFRRTSADRRPAPAPAARPGSEVPAAEKLLVVALLSNEEIRMEVLPRLDVLPALGTLATGRILATIATLGKQGNFGYADVEARLEESDRALLSSLVHADELGEEQHTLEQANACLRNLEQRDRESRRAGLRQQIKAAERAGDLAAALRLSEEFNAIGRS